MTVLFQVSLQGFIVSGSADGGVKFWKKQEQGIEFIKQFRAHGGPVEGGSVNRHSGHFWMRADASVCLCIP